MLYKAALTLPEMSSVLCIFKLLDRDGDGYLKLEDLKKAQSIEKKVVEGVLEVRLEENKARQDHGIAKTLGGNSFHTHLCMDFHIHAGCR